MRVAVKVGVNGFGRIGRLFTRVALTRQDIEVVAVNDLGDAKSSAHLFKYDSVHGIYPEKVGVEGSDLVIGDIRIKYLQESDPGKIPWADLGVEVVVEGTGRFTDKAKASAHFKGGAKKVVITAPADNADITLVIGVNDSAYDPQAHHVISNASCTTNCLAPLTKVVHERFGIVKGLMTTVHSYTNDQRILDLAHKDLRRARAAALSIVPTTTGAARAIGLVIPELKGKLNGMAIRVPTPNVSLVDLVAEVKQPATVEEINLAVKVASEGPMKGIIEYCDEPLVSKDFNGNPSSCIFDALSTMVVERNMVKVVGWYDNEWGYSSRVVDVVALLGQKGL
ncbi:glyceraldehyde-3-phosphate dehydrogenase, type I [Syntrophothermus lipocalidus DSM 12680]|uniref:Glyceraldehyde-3-phosphate dehydrogenase n=1 Tax=Syntrophothermus lipocalidus (strain DSM 12680 / TGB-C1) TaxID=643648 RepID=D7CPH1_SYNLT|nr:glyceraldehyde-3-phosphate dehydrogenase, type I [Syntrophothermus lipocalidus DSM 12680]